jgi:LDH2 family malate/lactate/ureidoglycolate dehydrogenase
MSPESASARVPAETLRAQLRLIFRAWGMAADQLEPTVQVMVETDLWGVDSHGISMLMMYDRHRRMGKLNFRAKPRVLRETAVMALIDADAGLGHAVSVTAMNLAVDKCQAEGVGVVSVVNSHHFGAAGVYANIAADRGAVGLVTSSTQGVLVVPTYGAEPVLGTNPLAFAAPARRHPPFLLDMATSTVAGNKLKVYAFHGKPLPQGWIVDRNGAPLTDAAEARRILDVPTGGGLTPLGATPELGSHKGYGLAVMVHILGGTLAGGSFSPIRKRTQKPEDPDNIGHFFLAIDPKAFRPDGAFEEDLDHVIDVLHATRPADPARPVLVAGDPEFMTREERLRDGVPIPEELMRHVEEIATAAGVEFLLRAPAGA